MWRLAALHVAQHDRELVAAVSAQPQRRRLIAQVTDHNGVPKRTLRHELGELPWVQFVHVDALRGHAALVFGARKEEVVLAHAHAARDPPDRIARVAILLI